MKTGHYGKFILLIIFFCYSWQNASAQKNVFRINVPRGFSGWAYMVGDTLPILTKDNSYTLDTSGVVYIDAFSLGQLDNVRVYREGFEITSTGARLMYAFKMTYERPRGHDLEIPVYYFYLLSPKESNLPEEYWSVEDNTEKLLLDENAHRQKLIDAGIIRLK